MNDPVTAYIALGSNLGDREATVHDAIQRLDSHDDIKVLTVSAMHETEPVGQSGQRRYINAAAKLRTTLDPQELLDALLAIERRLGRSRHDCQKWGPRTIDLDLLLYGDDVINRPGLVVPHPRMHERSFVLDPLLEIAAAVQHPVLGETIESLRQELLRR